QGARQSIQMSFYFIPSFSCVKKGWQFFCWIFCNALIYDAAFVGRISHSWLGEYASTVSADRSRRMKALHKPIILTTFVIVLGALFIFVWPTPYRYDRIQWSDGRSFPVRTNRFTGTAEWLLPGAGWEVVKQAESRNLEVKTDELKSMN